MKSDHTRSIRLEQLRKLAYRLSEQGQSPEYITLALKGKITQWGVSAGTAKDYFDVIVGQIGK